MSEFGIGKAVEDHIEMLKAGATEEFREFAQEAAKSDSLNVLVESAQVLREMAQKVGPKAVSVALKSPFIDALYIGYSLGRKRRGIEELEKMVGLYTPEEAATGKSHAH